MNIKEVDKFFPDNVVPRKQIFTQAQKDLINKFYDNFIEKVRHRYPYYLIEQVPSRNNAYYAGESERCIVISRRKKVIAIFDLSCCMNKFGETLHKASYKRRHIAYLGIALSIAEYEVNSILKTFFAGERILKQRFVNCLGSPNAREVV